MGIILPCYKNINDQNLDKKEGISPTEVKEILDDEKKESNSWILMLPLLTEWLITLGFYIHLKRRKKTVKEKMKKLILEQKSNIKGYTKDRASQLRKTLKLMEKMEIIQFTGKNII